MTRAKDPGSLKVGSGNPPATSTDRIVLRGAGGVPPNIGTPGYFPPDAVASRDGFPTPSDAPGASGLVGHVDDPVEAHPAFAIGLDPTTPTLFGNDTQEAVNEFASGMAVHPPMLGQHYSHMGFSGIPDWGVLKLQDANAVTGAPSADVYPYYWTSPTPVTDWAGTLATAGRDPQIDPIWNGDRVNPGEGISHIPGSGLGRAAAGAFTESGDVNRSRGVALQFSGISYVLPVTVSGTVFPADRGVLALIHWPAGNTVVDFLIQDILDRCIAAILLGSGISDGAGCITKDSTLPFACDGSPGTGPTSGSIFTVGLDASDKYDPFAYPGQASGQYDLHEIHTGISDIDSTTPLIIPWDTPWVRNTPSAVTGPGQVRLGTDPTADTTWDPATVTPYGIPVLGAGISGYNPAPVATIDVLDIPTGLPDTIEIVGCTLLATTNFFRYRLPYLKDYTRATGLKYTPHGLDQYTTRESARYFTPGAIFTYVYDATKMTVVGTTDYLNQAGDYTDFEEDHWNWQLARYRHSFYIPGSDTSGANLGTYWMIHFKTEHDFEAFVRDGIMPWDPTTPYEIYGASLVDTTGDDVASDYNLVNPLDSTVVGPPFGTPFAPGTGPAPDYGYAAGSYHALRSCVVTGESSVLPTVTSHTFDWLLNPIDGHAFVYTSGIAYFTPLNALGTWGFGVDDLNISISDPWNDFYRVDDNGLTPPTQIPPARMSSPCPVFLGLAPFAFEGAKIDDGSQFGVLGARDQRIEIPFEYTGTHGGNPFSDTNGPENADTVILTGLSHDFYFLGDKYYPAFSTDAAPVVFVRRPLATVPIQPIDAVNGNGNKLDVVLPVIGASILYHSTGWNLADPTEGTYGNFRTLGGAPQPCYAALVTALKDTEERFLDEVYRYFTTIGGAAPARLQLNGPGMAGWILGPIPAPTRIGATNANWTDPTGGVVHWDDNSWLQMDTYLATLAAGALQVGGLPHRNPSYPTTAIYPVPSAGMLLYPKIDYSAGYVPDNTVPGGGLPLAQPDYSSHVGTRTYIRCFDAAFARGSGTTPYDPGVAGQPLFTLRILGLKLEDFLYVAPGPGGLGDGLTGAVYTGISIMVKVPGLTTWMDLGRVDGAGPSKQDPLLDGAGCKVIGPYTYDYVDTDTQMVGCQVRVNVGPWANLANGLAVVANFEVPVLVKVVMNVLAKDYDLTEVYTGFPGQFGGVTTPGAAPGVVRGLCSIRVVHPTLVTSI